MDFLKQNPSANADASSLGLSSDFRELNLQKEFSSATQTQSQSRLKTTWKLPGYDKDDSANEFSRAPGSSAKQANSLSVLTRPDTGSWAGLDDSPNWSDGSGNGPQQNDLKETLAASGVGSGQSAYNLNDLVPEFEPGKPWKGSTGIKNIEDDPYITPGSVNRSPLSVNTIYNIPSQNWSSKTSPPPSWTANDSIVSSLSLSSSTWAFTPASSTLYNEPTKATASKPQASNWGSISSPNEITSPSSDSIWSSGQSMPKPRGPPPGLAQVKSTSSASGGGGAGSGNFWSSGDIPSNQLQQQQQQQPNPQARSWERSQNGTAFLLLRNLTPQIDGSTLKTLCMQHGPLQLFHLALNNGIALARYSTKEEAAKAQAALNNCVLGNTTILADIATEAEVHQVIFLTQS